MVDQGPSPAWRRLARGISHCPNSAGSRQSRTPLASASRAMNPFPKAHFVELAGLCREAGTYPVGRLGERHHPEMRAYTARSARADRRDGVPPGGKSIICGDRVLPVFVGASPGRRTGKGSSSSNGHHPKSTKTPPDSTVFALAHRNESGPHVLQCLQVPSCSVCRFQIGLTCCQHLPDRCARNRPSDRLRHFGHAVSKLQRDCSEW